MAPLTIVDSTLSDFPGIHAGLVDRWDSPEGWLVFRGLEAGPGISLHVIDADNGVYTTPQKKIVISSASAMSNQGINLGSGLGVYAGNSLMGLMQFRSIAGGDNVRVELVGDTLRISTSSVPVTPVTFGTPGPNMATVISGMVGSDMWFRRLVGGCGVQITEYPESIVFDSTHVGEITTASTVGTGLPVFKEKMGPDLRFRSFVAGQNVTLTQTADTLVIAAKGETTEGSNRGTAGAEVFATKVCNTMSFRRIRAGENVKVTQTPDYIEIGAINTGANNDGRSKGRTGDGGFEIYAGMEGDTLLFKKLYAGPNITILDNGCGLMIAAGVSNSSGGEANEGFNLGTGHPVYAGKVDQLLTFKTLVPGPGVALASNATEVMVSAQTDAVNLGTGVGVFENRSGSTLYFRSLTEGRGIDLDQDGDTVQISVKSATGDVMGYLPEGQSYDDPIAEGCNEPAILGWTPATHISEALHELNQLLGMALPPKPPALRSKTLHIAGSRDVVLTPDMPNNTGGQGPLPGERIPRITRLPAISTTVTDFRFGEKGTLTAVLNCNPVGEITLSRADDSGTNGSLEILRDAPYPANGGSLCLWHALSARINGPVPEGVNFYQLVHSLSGETNRAFFLYDPAPEAVIESLVVRPGTGLLVYSSSVPHYGTGSTLLVTLAIGDLTIQEVVEINGVAAIGQTRTLYAGDGIIPNPPDEFILLEDVVFTVDGDQHVTTRLQARMMLGTESGSTVASTELINVMTGLENPLATPLQEQAIQVVGLGSYEDLPDAAEHAARIRMSAGDTPADDVSSLLVGNWNSLDPLLPHDAAIVGGVLRADQTNYAAYLPPGPDLSGRDTDQYVTFMFRREAVSPFFIRVQGTYRGCWIKLPGYESQTPEAPNGWWDAFQLYGGDGIPGAVGNGPGCALPNGLAPLIMSGLGGVFRVTCGPANSSFSTNNMILVRFRLSGLDAITSLSFSVSP